MFYVDAEQKNENSHKLRGWFPTKELAEMHVKSWNADISKGMSVIPDSFIAGVVERHPPEHLQKSVAKALNDHNTNVARMVSSDAEWLAAHPGNIINSPRVQIEPKEPETVDLETKIMHFLVEALGGHSVTIVRSAMTPEETRMLGFRVGRGSFAIRDLLDVVNGPDDGRPCAMDKFVADLHEATDDTFERDEAITHWLYGSWDEAMAYLKDEDTDE
ncbi:hypothetical protein F406_gp032 [Agrobacterium phage 7-7-1]|uniref:Uncharacterized protein n=1 Tax=Agrobacterium phage 7-7-1 TaxID=1161931 RepID=J7FAR7_9CAUD|nr:hypothetical protein F406_gp032 [Agrobacterium phage 7-7-1]AFH19783.1 hypothetical protein 7-7-1_00085 [Agrobacterium phage 7-7-1]